MAPKFLEDLLADGPVSKRDRGRGGGELRFRAMLRRAKDELKVITKRWPEWRLDLAPTAHSSAIDSPMSRAPGRFTQRPGRCFGRLSRLACRRGYH